MNYTFATFLSALSLLVAVSCSNGGLETQFEETGPPTIAGASTSTNNDGTVTVVITGSGFIAGCTATVNGTDCTPLTILSSTQLQCNLPSSSIPLTNMNVTCPSSGGGSSSSGSVTPYHTIFVTSQTYNGTFSGLGVSGADLACTALANASALTKDKGGTWKAILSTTAQSASSRLSFSSGLEIRNVVGTPVVLVGGSLWTGVLNSPVEYNEQGANTGGFYPVWTGTSATGSTVDNCNNWNDTSAQGRKGLPNSSTSSWIEYTVILNTCASLAALYCVNQFP